jgi:hypothetical protein
MQRFLQLIELANAEGWKLDLIDFITGNEAPQSIPQVAPHVAPQVAPQVANISAQVQKLHEAQRVIAQQIQSLDIELQKYRCVTESESD